MSVTVLVVDDEPIARDGMSALVGATDGFRVIGACADGAHAIQTILELQPDLVLLDVQMPNVTGLDVVRRIGADRMPYVVFVTAFDQFAIDAFDFNALDYVLKPFTDERLRTALARGRDAVRARQLETFAARYSTLLAEFAPPPSERDGADAESLARHPERLAVRSVGSTTYVAVSDVEWIEGESYYARLHVSGKSVLIRESLQSLARRLDPRFVRVHRSAIVRIDRIRELRRDDNGDVAAILRDGTQIPVSKTRIAVLEVLLDR